MVKMVKSKDYIKGFKHGVRWAEIWLSLKQNEDEAEFYKMLKATIKSLKEGR